MSVGMGIPPHQMDLRIEAKDVTPIPAFVPALVVPKGRRLTANHQDRLEFCKVLTGGSKGTAS